MDEMTSLERVQAVLEGRIPDRLPVIPQGFMFSMHTAGYSIGQVNRVLPKWQRLTGSVRRSTAMTAA